MNKRKASASIRINKLRSDVNNLRVINTPGFMATRLGLSNAKKLKKAAEDMEKLKDVFPTFDTGYGDEGMYKMHYADISLGTNIKYASKAQRIENAKKLLLLMSERHSQIGERTRDTLLYVADKALKAIDFDKSPDQYITVSVDEVLDALGIQKKTKNGYTAGYKREDREEIFWQIRNLACIYVTFPKREYVKGKPEYKFVSSPVLEIAEIEYFVDNEGDGIPKFEWSKVKNVRFHVRFGKHLREEFVKLRQYAEVPRVILALDPYRQAHAKGILDYISGMIRVNQKNRTFEKTVTVETLANAAGIDLDKERGRGKEALEEAMDIINELTDFKIYYHTEDYDEGIVGKPNYIKDYKTWRVVIRAAEDIMRQYRDKIKEIETEQQEQSDLKEKGVHPIVLELEEIYDKLGMNDEDVEKHTGINATTLWRIRTGQTKRPQRSTLKELNEFVKWAKEEIEKREKQVG